MQILEQINLLGLSVLKQFGEIHCYFFEIEVELKEIVVEQLQKPLWKDFFDQKQLFDAKNLFWRAEIIKF